MHSNIVVFPIPFDPQMILKCGLKSKCNLNIGPIPFISIEFIRNICISSIQRPHHITSSYTYQFFEKSYFVSCAGWKITKHTPSPLLFFQFLTRKSTIRFSRNFTLFVIIAKHLQHNINISFFFHTDFTIYNF